MPLHAALHPNRARDPGPKPTPESSGNPDTGLNPNSDPGLNPNSDPASEPDGDPTRGLNPTSRLLVSEDVRRKLHGWRNCVKDALHSTPNAKFSPNHVFKCVKDAEHDSDPVHEMTPLVP